MASGASGTASEIATAFYIQKNDSNDQFLVG